MIKHRGDAKVNFLFESLSDSYELRSVDLSVVARCGRR
eukprot:COSAG01_NODE_428_length_17193_cov_45.999123_5_plen_38_part_00